MVSLQATALLLLALAGMPEPAARDAATASASTKTSTVTLGVVRLVRGRPTIEVESGGTAALAASGARFAAGATFDTGAGGWAELLVRGAGRVRLSAATRVVLDEDGLRLVSGRVWLQHADGARPYTIELPEGEARLERGTSALVEQGARTGSTLVVREGHAVLTAAEGGAVHVHAGELTTFAPGAKVPQPARAGGRALVDLADVEAKSVLGDVTGVRRFLLERIATAPVSKPRPRANIIRSSPEISGGDPASYTLESAARPSPFFESEVPPKGPNVKVEVTFGD